MSELLVYKASAGSGKTFTLAVEYIKLLILNHAGDEGSAVRQRRRGEAREVLHGLGPGTPGV